MPTVVQQPKSNDPFDFLGLDIGGTSTPAVVNQPVKVVNNGGDLLGGFSFDTPAQKTPVNQPIVAQNKGFDSLLDAGFLGGGISQPVQPPVQSFVPPPVVQPQSFGFDFLGTGPTVTTPVQPQFVQQPPQQANTFKFKAFETSHIEIWMDCKKESDGTRILVSFMNKTHNYVEQLNFQTAVMKYLKIVIQPLTGTSLPANSKGAVTQVMTVTNSALGEKPIVMKIKVNYSIIGQVYNFE